MTDPFDYNDPAGLEFELDLPAAPPERAAPAPTEVAAATPPAAPHGLTTDAAEDAPLDPPAPAAWEASDDAFSLELEEIERPVAQHSTQSVPASQTMPAVRAALALPRPATPQHRPPVRTLELRAAEAVDRMGPVMRGGLLALTIVSMVLLSVIVLTVGVRSARHAMEETARAQEAAAAAAQGDYDDDAYDDDAYDDGLK